MKPAPTGSKRKGKRRLCYLIPQKLIRLWLRSYFRLQAWNPERVPAHGSVIIAANHQSYLDSLVVACSVSRELHFLGKQSFLDCPILGSILAQLNVVGVRRDGRDGLNLLKFARRLRKGAACLIFPEGTRVTPDKAPEAKSGVGLLIATSIWPVVPVKIIGTDSAWGCGMTLPRPQKCMVKFGVPCEEHFTVFRQEVREARKERLDEIYTKIAEDLMAMIYALEPGDGSANP